MNKGIKRWIIGICVGMCIPILAYVVYNYVHRNDKYARVARVVGVDVDTWATLNILYAKATNQYTLTQSEIDQMRSLLTHSKREVRYRALYALAYCTDDAVKPQAMALIKSALDDKEPLVRMRAIKGLKRLNDPNLTADVGRLVNDPTRVVSESAKEALSNTPE